MRLQLWQAFIICTQIIDLGQIAKFGMTFWLPLASAANLAQGGAALAVALKTKDQKIKSMAVPSALSACMGITEPAIFGVNLRFGKPFVMACIGGACGALFASVTALGQPEQELPVFSVFFFV